MDPKVMFEEASQRLKDRGLAVEPEKVISEAQQAEWLKQQQQQQIGARLSKAQASFNTVLDNMKAFLAHARQAGIIEDFSSKQFKAQERLYIRSVGFSERFNQRSTLPNADYFIDLKNLALYQHLRNDDNSVREDRMLYFAFSPYSDRANQFMRELSHITFLNRKGGASAWRSAEDKRALIAQVFSELPELQSSGRLTDAAEILTYAAQKFRLDLLSKQAAPAMRP